MCAGLTGQTATEVATNADGTPAQQGSSWYIIVIYVVIFAAFIYFIMIRPSRKQKKQQEETMSSMQPGDSVLTTSGFYGTIVAVNGDTVIVEFGNNKNCRIPMAKQAISQVEKAGSAGTTSAEAAPVKKFFGRKKDAEEITETAKEESGSDSQSESSSDSSSDSAQ
ncbi:MAG: preprotein translocase subunit YajC [Parasporobacterium sp.]|nr:preprotein translocase subunit YajC [Parasporobacterium sp.]